MRIRFLLTTVGFIILIILSGCSPDFNTDFDPPKPEAKLTDIFPDEIDGMAAADEYFEFAIVPNFDKMKNHFRGNVNGKWRANGTDEKGRKWYGWVNNNWVFLLNGSDTKYFKIAIDAFNFVEE